MNYVKRSWVILLIVAMTALVLAGCGSNEAPAPAPDDAAAVTVGALDDTYADALGISNQLLLGSLKLEGTPNAITAVQAKQLLPLWQAFKTLFGSNVAATEEVEAVQNQILSTMSQEQVVAIAGLRLTNADLAAYYAELGLSMPAPQPGVTPGSKRNLSDEERTALRATAEALGTPVGTGGGGSSQKTVLLDNLLELLSARQTN